jgi:hypothetical protein
MSFKTPRAYVRHTVTAIVDRRAVPFCVSGRRDEGGPWPGFVPLSLIGAASGEVDDHVRSWSSCGRRRAAVAALGF